MLLKIVIDTPDTSIWTRKQIFVLKAVVELTPQDLRIIAVPDLSAHVSGKDPFDLKQ